MQETYSLVNNTCMEIKASASSFLKSSINFWWFFWLFYPCIRYFWKFTFQEKRINCSLEIWWTFVNLYEIWRNSRNDLNVIFQKKKFLEHWSLVKTCEFWIEWNQISDIGDHTSTFMYICSGGQLSKIESPFCFEMSYILARRSSEICMIQAGL